MRRTALALVMVGVLGCTRNGEDNHTYLPTTWYYFQPESADFSTYLYLVSTRDVSSFEVEAGVTQTAGNGIILGSVRDAAGAPVSGVEVEARTDTFTSAGTPVYNNASGIFDPFLTSTSSLGEFIILNVTPGRVNLRCLSGASGNIYVTAAADEFTLVTLTTATAASAITWSGKTRRLLSMPDLPVAAVTIERIGAGAPAASDGAGDFTIGTVPASNEFLLKLSEAGSVDTYNQFIAGTTNLTSPTGDLLIVADPPGTNFKPASLTWTAGTAIIRGEIAAAFKNGYTITCTTLDGTPTGTVWYADASGAPPDPATLTSTNNSGIFYIYNVTPGTVLVTATQLNYGGSTYVEAFADSVTLIQGQLAPVSNLPGTDTITVDGYVVALTTPTIGIRAATIELRGLGVTAMSDDYGYFTLSDVPSNHRLLLRTTK